MILEMSGGVELSDLKGPRDVTFKWNLKRLDGLDPRGRRTTPESLLQRRERLVRATRNYFNRTIREIAHPAAELESLGFGRDKPPEPDSLNPTLDNPAAEAQTAEARLRRRRHR
jgi:hypothetical protein